MGESPQTSRMASGRLDVDCSPAALRARRESLGVSQETLARAIGVSVNTLVRWERGTQRIGDPCRVLRALRRLERRTPIESGASPTRLHDTRSDRVATPDRGALVAASAELFGRER